MYSTVIVRALESASARNSTMQSARLEALPVELKLAILTCFTDSQSTVNVALTGPVFYCVVAENETELAAKLFLAGIPEHLLPMVDLRQRLSNVSITKSDLTGDFAKALADVTDQAFVQSNRHWTYYTQAGICLETSRTILQDFESLQQCAKSLAQHALQNAPKGLDYTTLSADETNRFINALYVLEIISKGFSVASSDPDIDPERLYGHAWLNLWSKFGPWMMQHVRIVQSLLGTQVQDAIENELEQGYGQDLGLSSGDLGLNNMASFVLSRGPRTLQQLKEQKGATTLAARDFLQHYERGLLRVNAHDRRHDTLWLNHPKEGEVSLDCQHIIDRYGDDISAATIWYGNAMASYADNIDLEVAAYERQCTFCLDKWAFALWDLVRLQHKGPLPTIEQIAHAEPDLCVNEERYLGQTYAETKKCSGYCSLGR